MEDIIGYIFFIWIRVDYAVLKFVEILALPLESTGRLPKLTPLLKFLDPTGRTRHE